MSLVLDRIYVVQGLSLVRSERFLLGSSGVAHAHHNITCCGDCPAYVLHFKVKFIYIVPSAHITCSFCSVDGGRDKLRSLTALSPADCFCRSNSIVGNFEMPVGREAAWSHRYFAFACVPANLECIKRKGLG